MLIFRKMLWLWTLRYSNSLPNDIILYTYLWEMPLSSNAYDKIMFLCFIHCRKLALTMVQTVNFECEILNISWNICLKIMLKLWLLGAELVSTKSWKPLSALTEHVSNTIFSEFLWMFDRSVVAEPSFHFVKKYILHCISARKLW